VPPTIPGSSASTERSAAASARTAATDPSVRAALTTRRGVESVGEKATMMALGFSSLDSASTTSGGDSVPRWSRSVERSRSPGLVPSNVVVIAGSRRGCDPVRGRRSRGG
jgi:hypothetical protein